MTEQDEHESPGLNLAYDFIAPSYSMLAQRIEAVHGRIQALQTFAASITLAIPVLVRSIIADISFGSGWLILALVVFVLLVVVGILGTTIGSLILPHPGRFRDGWLQYGPRDFKRYALDYAATHFEHNGALINRKGKVLVIMALLLLAEVILLCLWLLGPTAPLAPPFRLSLS